MKGFDSHPGIRDFFDETVILFNQVIQIVNLLHFNKTEQNGKHQQDVNVLQSGIDGLFEGGCGRRFITVLGQHEIKGSI